MLYDLLFVYKNISFENKLIIFFTFAFAVIFSLTIHEFAHGAVANKLGDNTAKLAGRLSLNPMVHFDYVGMFCFLFLGFGWAKPVPINPYNFHNIKRDTFLVSIAGICVNLICAFICYPFALLFARGSGVVMTIFYCLFSYLFEINLVFAVFNLLPIYPLDGFNALASQLKYTNPYVTFMQRYGSFVLLAVIIIFSQTNIFSFLVNKVGYPITWFWSLIFGA